MKYTVLHPMTLLDALQALAPASSKTTLRSWLKDGRVQLNGKEVKIASTPVEAGQLVTVGAKEKHLPKGVQILYEDKHLIAIIKPEGLLSVATLFEKGLTAHTIIKEYVHPRKVYVVHRLDQDTSGVMLFAFTDEAYKGLKSIFEKHAIDREYTAVVEGHLESLSGSWSCYLYEDEKYHVHATDDPEKGEYAITHYEVRKQNPKYTLLNLKLETGKKNQIRVHCQEAGHPVSGDKKYGAEHAPLRRLCLHAHLLAFTHPVTKKEMRFEAPAPQGFFKLVRR